MRAKSALSAPTMMLKWPCRTASTVRARGRRRPAFIREPRPDAARRRHQKVLRGRRAKHLQSICLRGACAFQTAGGGSAGKTAGLISTQAGATPPLSGAPHHRRSLRRLFHGSFLREFALGLESFLKWFHIWMTLPPTERRLAPISILRFTMAVPDQLLHALRTWGRLPAGELVSRLGISRPTLMRAVRALGTQVVARGQARRTTYAARRAVRGSWDPVPLYRIDAQGAYSGDRDRRFRA